MLFTKIQELCKEHGISIANLERKTGIGNGVIATWKRANPTIGSLIKVCKVFHCKVEDIITDEVYDYYPIRKAQ